MPSSTSSSDAAVIDIPIAVVRDAPRLTAADRPGVAQPVPERDIPSQPWNAIFFGAALLFIALIAGWEMYWRSQGSVAGYYNSNAEWAQQRRRIDTGEGNKTVLIGSSRILFDVQLPVWERVTGERPIQLAVEGTSAVPLLEDLAADPNFNGRLVIGVASDLFFTGFAYRGDVIPFYHKESPSQRVGNWLSRTFIEPYFAFDDYDFALGAVLKRRPWPPRPDKPPHFAVRKLLVQESDRNSHMWSKLETDAAYRELCRAVWAQEFDDPPPPSMDTPEKLQKAIDKQIARAVDAITKLRARGVPMIFVRPPTAGRYLEFDNRFFPRERTWDVLLKQTNTPGIHFTDYPELQGYELPEWSHMTKSEAERYTEALVAIIQRDFWKPAPK